MKARARRMADLRVCGVALRSLVLLDYICLLINEETDNVPPIRVLGKPYNFQ